MYLPMREYARCPNAFFVDRYKGVTLCVKPQALQKFVFAKYIYIVMFSLLWTCIQIRNQVLGS